MSTYYTGILISKAQDKPIKVINDDIDCNFIKSCMNGWDIEGEECYPRNEDFEKEVKERTKFVHEKFLLTVKKSDFASDTFKGYEITACEKDSDKVIFNYNNDNEMDLLKKIIVGNMQVKTSNEDMKRLADMTENEKEEYYEQFYNVFLRHPTYYRGAFYSEHSFNDVEKNAEQHLNEIAENKKRWTELKNSIDYLKLSEEEKENVENSFEGKIEDYDNEWLCTKEAASKVRHLCEAFSGWRDEEVYLYIYSDNAEYDELPEWVTNGRVFF